MKGRGRLVEEFEEVVLIVRFVVLFFEGVFVELFEVEGIDEVFWVEFFGYGGDVAVGDGFLVVRV